MTKTTCRLRLFGGVDMDVLGIAYDEFPAEQRDYFCQHHPRGHGFKENTVDAFARRRSKSGAIKKPLTTFGNVKADVLVLKEPIYQHFNFCSIIRGSS